MRSSKSWSSKWKYEKGKVWVDQTVEEAEVDPPGVFSSVQAQVDADGPPADQVEGRYGDHDEGLGRFSALLEQLPDDQAVGDDDDDSREDEDCDGDNPDPGLAEEREVTGLQDTIFYLSKISP